MDGALEKLSEMKSDKIELKLLSQSIDTNKTLSIFNDMKTYLDTTVLNLE